MRRKEPKLEINNKIIMYINDIDQLIVKSCIAIEILANAAKHITIIMLSIKF